MAALPLKPPSPPSPDDPLPTVVKEWSLHNLLADMQLSYPSGRSLRTLYMLGRVSQGAAVESCQLALHPLLPIRYNASLCTTTRCSAQLPVPERIYWLFSDPVGPGVCTMLYAGFREFYFHAVRE
jgi:hypothetical protein